MAKEEFAEKIENTVAGVKHFAFRFVNTLLAVGFRPKQLTRALADDGAGRAFLGPNAFLLSCAIALGVIGKTLRRMFESTEVDVSDVIDQFNDLTITSFLIESVTVFLIALVGSAVVHAVMWGYGDEEKRHIKNVNYYVIGYFGLGSFLILLLMLIAIPSSPDVTRWPLRWLRPMAAVVVVSWVLFCFTLMQRMSFHLLHMAASRRSMLPALARIAVANVVVLVLCIANFVTPAFQSVPAALMRGSLIDLELQPDGNSIRLTYAVMNDAQNRLVVNQAERPTVGAEIPDEARIDPRGSFQEGCGLAPVKDVFIAIDPGKAAVLTSCVRSPELLGILKDSGFVEGMREGNRRRLTHIGGKALDLSVRIEVAMEGGKSSRQEVRLLRQKAKRQAPP